MRWLRISIFLFATILMSAYLDNVLGSSASEGHAKALTDALSPEAKVYFPNSTEFGTLTTRWSSLAEPIINVAVVPATEDDVVKIVQYANKENLPILAFNGAHAAITTLGRMQGGIEIYLGQLSSVSIAPDNQTVTVGGGTLSKAVTDTLWSAGKETVTGTCECVSVLGPALGGGHGWLQGHYGLVADQFVSMNVVLADGTLQTIDENSDLWWGMKGAGQNFGIVTSLTSKIYDRSQYDWAIETLIFDGDKVEALYQAANDHLANIPVNLINWSYWLNIPSLDPNKPIILFYIIQEGATSVDPTYTKPFHDIGALSVEAESGTYKDVAGWVQIALDSAPCQKSGLANPRFPAYIKEYNVPAQKLAYDTYAANVSGDSPFTSSIFMFESYPVQGVQAIDGDSTAFAFRSDNMLTAPLITYTPAGKDLDDRAAELGNQLREIIRQGSGSEELHAYVNYAYGDETPQNWYGYEQWRQDRLKALKTKYDPEGRFSFFAPVE
ncbi:putative FAD-dependent oxygenase [Annulohypoxylon maeteangense]|uniref:putative FAD-dependent oxygenase n=1 Tax=Annulohypoxylon maeteangense TaxID=1927788 RepID=UPI002008281E|nr:putative FAD-dependent oxygenase [Annulohypoxylon maeteangense]KAI0889717.1 putative FAD-dependent oxygenase [Annulohypoxylon maeteangense]